MRNSWDFGAIVTMGHAFVLAHRHVFDVMEAVFNRPMSSLQLEQALRDSDRRREACHPIADRLMPFAFGLKAAADLKDAAPDQANRSSP